MAISTSALEVTPGPLRFHLGRGGGDGPLPAGGGEGGTREGRPDPIPDPIPGPARPRTLPRVPAGLAPGPAAAAAPRRFLPPPLKVRSDGAR